jgi:3,4-dihydroxy 2-butanone 4-phosphate synthase/GTP cyclohydrolase II
MTSTLKAVCTPFRSEFGMFEMHAYRFDSGHEHLALISGDPGASATPLVRVQSSCLTGTAMHAELCDCRQQLHLALQLVGSSPDGGCVIYLDQEGRGHGLVAKVAQLALIAKGLDTVEAAAAHGEPPDLRRWDEAAAILKDLIGDKPIRLLTNNPYKSAGLAAAGVLVMSECPIQAPVTEGNRAYLRVKRDKMGHRLDLD